MPESYIQPVTDRQSCYKCQKSVTGKMKLSKCSRCHAITYCGKQCRVADWPRHGWNCVPVMVTEYEGKGRGLVAARDIKKGELIFMDKPLLKMEAEFRLDTVFSLAQQIENLPSEARLFFYKLKWDKYCSNSSKELDIFCSNAREIGGWWILFLNAALVNHSCAPNSSLDTIKEEGGTSWCEVKAIKDIVKGEEVTVFYESGAISLQEYSYQVYGCNAQERKMAIKKNFNFDCKCCVCSEEVPEQEEIIKQLLHLHRALKLNNSRKEPSELAKKVKIWDQIVDLNLKLYIGSVCDKIWSMQDLGEAAQEAEDEILEKKAFDGLKKIAEDYKLNRVVKWCKENA